MKIFPMAPIGDHTLAHARADALVWASGFTTDRHDPLAVIRNAEPIIEWLESTPGSKDLTLRRRAGNQQWINDDDRDPDDDPDGFLLRVTALYGAMVGTAWPEAIFA